MSRPLLIVVLLLALAAPAGAEQDTPESHAFVEIVAEREPVYVGEPFTLGVRIGVDRAFFDEHVVELFRRKMDLPVQVAAPWLAAPEGTRALDEPSEDGDVRLAVEGRAMRAVRRPDIVRDGTTFEVVELTRRYLPEEVGAHPLEASLRFGYATRFEEDFLGGRVAVDRRDVAVRAPAFTLTVSALPEEGRPASFSGAVGRYTMASTLAPAASGTNESLELTLRIEGAGNLAFVDPPSSQGIAGFHVYGFVDDHQAPLRTVVYEIAPLPGTTEVPAIPFAYFDPGPPATYRVALTDPIPLARPVPTPAATPPDDAFRWPWALALLGIVLLGLGVASRRRRLARARAQRPRTSWASRLEGADPAEVLVAAVASHLGVAPAAVIGPDLSTRLERAGVADELATRTARTLETLVGQRFGGDASVDRRELAALLDTLDAVFAPDDDMPPGPGADEVG